MTTTISAASVAPVNALFDLGALLPELKSPCRILEVSCGDGLTGYLLAEAGHDVWLSDIENWRFKKARSLPFEQANICTDLGLSDEHGQFDIVIAYNATEHWEDPSLALRRLLQLCRPDGLIVMDFGPLFNSPWGLHAWCFNFPYPQFLFSKAFIEDKVRSTGVTDLARNLENLQETNGWSVRQFRNLWHGLGCRVEHLFEDLDMRYLNMIEEFPDVFCSLDLTLDELTVNSIEIVLRRSGT